MNKVILIGNLTRDPELSTTPSGVSVCKMGVAVNRRFKSADGEVVTDFFNVVVWRAQAENCHRYLKKGNKVGLTGELQTRNYDDKDGIKRYVTEVVADEVEFLTPKQGDNAPSRTNQETMLTPIDDDEMPF